MVWIYHCLTVHLLKAILIFSSFCYYKESCHEHLCTVSFGHKFSVLWDKYPEKRLLRHTINICLVFKRHCQTILQSG